MRRNVLKSKWKEAEQSASLLLQRHLRVSELTATLLVNRGLVDPAAADAFLNPSLEDLHDPFLMCGMRAAVDRICRAIEGREKIWIYGDYDVDGTTSTVILKRALAQVGADVAYYIPERLKDGYGLREDAMDSAKSAGVGLVISVDTGIRAQRVVEYARTVGVDVIITDHHLPEDDLPEAVAVLNPQRRDCPYPDKNLAGVGVAFKLAEAILTEFGERGLRDSFIEIAALGTIADVVPLVGENRVIATFGLRGMATTGNVGLQALLEVSGLAGKTIRASDVGFRLGPRINAAGRMAGASAVVELFDAPDRETAVRYAEVMNQQNTERQEAEARILEKVEVLFSAGKGSAGSHVAVIAGEGWHRGVIGIVASRLVERLSRPAIVISLVDGMGHGSGRSIRAFHLLDGLTSCAELFERFGGHSHAAGLAIREDRIAELRQRLNDYAASILSEEDLVPVINVDCRLPLTAAIHATLDELARFEPFGPGNPQPVFETTGARLASSPRIIKDKHVKIAVQGPSGRQLDCIWWGGANRGLEGRRGDRVDLAYALSENVFNGVSQVQLVLRDVDES